MKRLLLLLSVFFTFFSVSVYAEEIPSSPPSNGDYDPHNYLNQDIIDKVGELNKEWSETTLKPQIAVAIIDSLDKDIESVANETARAWKVGYSGTDNGILLVIAIKDKKIRTETSNNLSTLITDSKASSLNRTVKSDFRRGDYSAGVSAYLSELSSFMTPYLSNSASEIKEKKSEEEKDRLNNLAKKLKQLFKLLLIALIILFPLTLPILLIQYLIRRYDNRYSGYTGYTENGDDYDDEYSKKKQHDSAIHDSGSSYVGSGSSYTSSDFGSSSHSSSYDSSSSWSGGDSWSGGGFDGGGSSGDW